MQIHRETVIKQREPLSILYGAAPSKASEPRRAYVALSMTGSTAENQQVQILQYIPRPRRGSIAPSPPATTSTLTPAPPSATSAAVSESQIYIEETVQLMKSFMTPHGEVLLVAGRKLPKSSGDTTTAFATAQPGVQLTLYSTNITSNSDKVLATAEISAIASKVEAFFDDRSATIVRPDGGDDSTAFFTLPVSLQPLGGTKYTEAPVRDVGCEPTGYNGTLVWAIEIVDAPQVVRVSRVAGIPVRCARYQLQSAALHRLVKWLQGTRELHYSRAHCGFCD